MGAKKIWAGKYRAPRRRVKDPRKRKIIYKRLLKYIRLGQNNEYSVAWVTKKFKLDEKTAKSFLDRAGSDLAKEGISFRRSLTREERNQISAFEANFIREAKEKNQIIKRRQLARDLNRSASSIGRLMKKHGINNVRTKEDLMQSLREMIAKTPGKTYTTSGVAKDLHTSKEKASETLVALSKEMKFKRRLSYEEQKARDARDRGIIIETLRNDHKANLWDLSKTLNRPYGTVKKMVAIIRHDLSLPSGRRGPY